MKKLTASTAMLALALVALSGSAIAQTVPSSVPATPSVSDTSPADQVNQRLQNQQKAIDAGVAGGKLDAAEAAKDQKKETHIATKLSADEAKNGGTITKAEQAKLNKKLDKNKHRIHHQMTKTVTTAPVTPVVPAQ